MIDLLNPYLASAGLKLISPIGKAEMLPLLNPYLASAGLKRFAPKSFIQRSSLLNPYLASAGLKQICLSHRHQYLERTFSIKPVSGFGWIETQKC